MSSVVLTFSMENLSVKRRVLRIVKFKLLKTEQDVSKCSIVKSIVNYCQEDVKVMATLIERNIYPMQETLIIENMQAVENKHKTWLGQDWGQP